MAGHVASRMAANHAERAAAGRGTERASHTGSAGYGSQGANHGYANHGYASRGYATHSYAVHAGGGGGGGGRPHGH